MSDWTGGSFSGAAFLRAALYRHTADIPERSAAVFSGGRMHRSPKYELFVFLIFIYANG